MTNEMQNVIVSLFEKTAEKNESLSKVFNEVYKVMHDHAHKVGGLHMYFFPQEAEAKKANKADLFKRFCNAMPHVKYAGEEGITVCDFVEYDEEKEYTGYFVEARTNVDDEVHTYVEAVNVAEAEREVNKTEKVTLASGYVLEVASKDAEGKQLKENKVVKVVPREKTRWGYTSVVRKALINAFTSWEIEQGLA